MLSKSDGQEGGKRSKDPSEAIAGGGQGWLGNGRVCRRREDRPVEVSTSRQVGKCCVVVFGATAPYPIRTLASPKASSWGKVGLDPLRHVVIEDRCVSSMLYQNEEKGGGQRYQENGGNENTKTLF